MRRLRYSIKQLSAIILVAAVALAGYGMVANWQRHRQVSELYGSQEFFQLLASAESADIYKVLPLDPRQDILREATFPRVLQVEPRGALSKQQVDRLSVLMTNLDKINRNGWVKDYVFRPSVLVTLKRIGHPDVELYCDFDSKEIGSVVRDVHPHFLPMDNIHSELAQILEQPSTK